MRSAFVESRWARIALLAASFNLGWMLQGCDDDEEEKKPTPAPGGGDEDDEETPDSMGVPESLAQGIKPYLYNMIYHQE